MITQIRVRVNPVSSIRHRAEFNLASILDQKRAMIVHATLYIKKAPGNPPGLAIGLCYLPLATISLSSFPGLNLTTFLAAMLMGFLV